MHEMALCESLLQLIEEQQRRHGFRRVRRVRLEVGRLAGVEVEALRFGFDVVTRGSVAEGAALEILEPPGRAWCMACEAEVEIAHRYDPCPRCGGYGLGVRGGDAMRVLDLEVD
ncbi:hydrogenase maturation nickel metallochaperone HypA [Inmirania thermothiophila]|uniref:Hydrogenase maturation factor HypA n=1 Tax=Inmirania thermothiophila TaxID=1750597 RepID=A0A3N1Y162_9GAMM|nr:hydrogenase maturation nickel metallochaperone HypA [Inmirania thermothiophila]ROR32530.1 hydrogenase nickel incorporation protein HypA/HybF [Inmirania thermothiophila]